MNDKNQTPEISEPNSVLRMDAERKLSTNFFVRLEVSGNIFDLQTTVRDAPTQAELENHVKAIQGMMILLVEQGGISKNVGTPPAGVTSTATVSVLPPAAQDGELPPPAAQGAPQQTDVSELTFVTQKLKVTMSGNTKYFKVTGGKYSKYGVKVWPEVLGKVANCDLLDPIDYDFPGYLATYILDENGKPDKIINLEKNE